MPRVRCIGADARSCFRRTVTALLAQNRKPRACTTPHALTVAPSNRLCAGATNAAHEASGRQCKCALAQTSAPHAYHTPVLNRSSLRAGIGPPELLRIPLPHALLQTGRRPSASHEARERTCLRMNSVTTRSCRSQHPRRHRHQHAGGHLVDAFESHCAG